MKFMLTIFHGTTPLPGTPAWDAMPEEEQQRIYAEYGAINKIPGLEPGLPLGLPSAARTVTARNGTTEVKSATYLPEGAGAYVVLEAENIEAAIEVAAKFPAARIGGAVEVRAVEKYW